VQGGDPEPPWQPPPPAEPTTDTADDWAAEPGFAAVAVEEPPAEAAADWAPAAAPIDVTDHTVEMPALAPPPAPGRRRVWRAGLTLVLLLACVGGALAASGVLTKKDEMPPPVRIGAASSIAPKPAQHAKPKAKPVKHRHHAARHHARRHRRAHRHAAPATAHFVAAAPARPTSPRPTVHRVVSRPAPRPAPKRVSAPRPAPKPVVRKPTTTVSQPAPSAPSGEPGRQPQPSS
jgi:hypothetical protein